VKASCWLVVEAHPGEDLRSGTARGCPRFTIHGATDEELVHVAKNLGAALGGGTPTQVGCIRLEACAICAAPDDDTRQPPRHRIEILTPRGWLPDET
jgi:hypothetical protein